MSSAETFKEGRVNITDGEVEFDIYTLDGICLPPFQALKAPGGFPKRIRDIMDMDIRADDVLMATYPKCGSHWTYEVLNMLLQGKAEYHKSRKVELMLDAVPKMKMAADFPSPRVLNLHLPYRWFPKKHLENGGKIIHVTRNPKDAYVSFFYHLRNSFEFGPKAKNVTWKQYFDNCVVGEACFYGSWFAYEKQMAEAKRINKNIYTLRYENLKKDSATEIKNLAGFLGINVTDDLVREIVKNCSFQNMKKADSDVKEFSPEIMDYFKKVIEEDPQLQLPNLYRKGEVGDWKNHFTVAQNELFNEIYRKEMEGIDVDVYYEM